MFSGGCPPAVGPDTPVAKKKKENKKAKKKRPDVMTIELTARPWDNTVWYLDVQEDSKLEKLAYNLDVPKLFT